ncbi:MAG: hypothetical protein SCJ94_10515 [Bacillota bacterium]|nr:hypothetical protein [Bacillota bacterium]
MVKNTDNAQRILDYINGALIYYGIIHTDEMLDIVRQNLQVQLDRKEFDKIIAEALKDDNHDYYFSRSRQFLYNTGIEDPADVLNEQSLRPNIDYKNLTEKEALDALNLELSNRRDRYTNKIMNFLMSKGWSDDKAASALLDMELDLNNGAQQINLIKGFLKEVDFTSEKELNQFMNMISDFFNNTPQWILKGWTPSEIHSRFEKSSLKPLKDEPSVLTQKQLDPEKPTTAEHAAASVYAEETESSPSLQEWSALYDAAIRFKAMQCWEWMFEDEIFGVRNPETGEIAYVSIMGTLGQVYALYAYRGAEGLQSLSKPCLWPINVVTIMTF